LSLFSLEIALIFAAKPIADAVESAIAYGGRSRHRSLIHQYLHSSAMPK
jgi:hypothetical protein